MDIKIALDNFIERYVCSHQTANQALEIEYDPEWPSPCYQAQPDSGHMVNWRPVLRESAGGFVDLENALDIGMDAQLQIYFGRYWCDNLNAKTTRGQLQLLQAWNQADFERLQQNLIGHILMKRRLKQPETWFFAITDEDDFIISIDANNGKVVLERVGLLPQEVLADDLCSFLQSLEPAISL